MQTIFNKKKVMVLDGEWPSALSIVRSLGRRGIPISVGSSQVSSLTAKSKYCTDHFVYPDPLCDVGGFIKTLTEQIHTNPYELIIPVTDLTICPMMKVRDQIEAKVPIAMASNKSLSVVLSKSRTGELAKGIGIPMPRSWTLTNLEELRIIREELSFPVVIKPDSTKSWSSDQIGKDISVCYAGEFCELVQKATSILEWSPIVLQEYVEGEGVGMAVLADEGDVKTVFQYRRLHEVPLTGGASSYRISEPVDPLIEGYASMLMKALSWNGVAMIEFKRSKEKNSLYLLEINGRFWGSLPLAVTAGADFPYYLYQYLVHRQNDIPRIYKIGTRCRNIQKEVEWLKSVLFRTKTVSSLTRYPTYSYIFMDSLRFLNPTERSDTLNFADPIPGLHDVGEIYRSFVEYIKKKIIFATEFRRMERAKKEPRSLLEKIASSKALLFICAGNVIRSPFAAGYLGDSLNGNQNSLLIQSAGLDAVPGRKAHPRTVQKAKDVGLNLSSHRAVLVNDEMVREADMIIVMEVKHLFSMKKRYPEAMGKIFLLGCFSEDNLMEIPDPDSKNDEIFESCFNQIMKAVDPMADSLNGVRENS